ncbi:hypothetical protein COBT_002627, partial [Conglomerata obtusa]
MNALIHISQKYLYKDIIFGSDFYIDTILNDKFERVIEAFKNDKKDTYKNKQNNENIESAEQNTDNKLKFAESHLDTIANENSNDLKVITKNIGGILLISIILKNMFIGILTGQIVNKSYEISIFELARINLILQNASLKNDNINKLTPCNKYIDSDTNSCMKL